MTTIDGYSALRHIVAGPGTHVLHHRGGRLVGSSRGASFWYRPLTTSIALVPVDDREVDLSFHCRTLDFQDLFVQGVATFRVIDPELLASRIDFSIDVHTGVHTAMPIEQLASRIRQASQEHVLAYVASQPLRAVLTAGVEPVRSRISGGLASDGLPEDLGIELVAVRVSAIAPSPEVEASLQTPAREQVQQQADEAVFQRRALAVDKERAIEENELANRIELARRTEQLVARQGANRRLEATEAAAAERIEAEAEAERITIVGTARAEMERRQVEVYSGLDPVVLLALAAREAASQLPRIEQLVLAPDMVAGALAGLTRRSA